MNVLGIGCISFSILLVFLICTMVTEKYYYENIYNSYKIYKRGPQDSQIYVAKVRISKWFPIYKWYKADAKRNPKVFNSIPHLKNDLSRSYENYLNVKKTEKERNQLIRIE